MSHVLHLLGGGIPESAHFLWITVKNGMGAGGCTLGLCESQPSLPGPPSPSMLQSSSSPFLLLNKMRKLLRRSAILSIPDIGRLSTLHISQSSAGVACKPRYTVFSQSVTIFYIRPLQGFALGWFPASAETLSLCRYSFSTLAVLKH